MEAKIKKAVAERYPNYKEVLNAVYIYRQLLEVRAHIKNWRGIASTTDAVQNAISLRNNMEKAIKRGGLRNISHAREINSEITQFVTQLKS